MKQQTILFIIGSILSLILMLIPWELFRYALGVILFWIWPALIWDSFLSRKELYLPERIVIALGLSFVVSLVTTLALTYLPGQITTLKLMIGLLIGFSLPIILNVNLPSSVLRRRSQPITATATNKLKRAEWIILFLIVAVAAGTRLINLGYSEFQGDEADVVVKAAHVLTGDTAVLFEHKKGPAEILLVVSEWAVTGITNEWMARFPFALLNILGIGVVFLIGWRLGNLNLAVIAALLLAIEGYLVGFGRIVQYQSLVFSFSALAIYLILLYRADGHGRYLVLAAVFYAGAALAHYDAILALPAGLLLLADRLWRERQRFKDTLPGLITALLVGAVIVGVFYWPYLRGSQFGSTSAYLLGRIGSEHTGFNHLPSTLERTAVYNSIYFLGLIALAIGFQTWHTWRTWGRWGLFGAFVVMLAAVTVFVWPDQWQMTDLSLAWVPFTFWLLGSFAAPGQSMLQRMVWLWFGLPFLFYSFFVAVPLTHIYTAVPGAMLLAAAGLVNFSETARENSRMTRRVAIASGGVIYLLSLFYILMVFVDHTPEYVRTFPDSKSPLYRSLSEEIPKEGRFGFPYRAGWKAVGYLMDTGELGGSYDSNEEHEITDYYTRQAIRIDCARPDIFVTAVNVQDEVPIRTDQLENDFKPSTLVYVSGRPKITIYQQNDAGLSATIDVKSIEWQFDQGTTPERIAAQSPRTSPINPDEFIARTAYIGDFAQLLGYRMDATHAVPGGYVELTLLWQALKPTLMNYQVFTHLHDGTTMRGQLDGQPACGSAPTSEWQVGQQIVDPYRIPINADAGTGIVPLTIGLYDLATLQRLPVVTADGSPDGDNLFLTEIDIRENEAVVGP